MLINPLLIFHIECSRFTNLLHFYSTEDLPHDERERIHVCQPERLERSLLVNTETTGNVEQKQNDFCIGLVHLKSKTSGLMYLLVPTRVFSGMTSSSVEF